MANEIISRDDAKAQGLKRYFTGQLCCCGHVAERLVSNYGCLPCLAARSKASRLADPESRRAYEAKWRATNSEKAKRNLAKYRAANRDKINESRRVRRADPEVRAAYLVRRRELRSLDREKWLEADRKRRRDNPDKAKEYSRRHYCKNRDKELARCKQWRSSLDEASRQKINTQRRVWRERSKSDPEWVEKRNAYARRYYREKPNITAAGHKRRALKRGSIGSHSAADLLTILKSQNGKCAYCRLSLSKRKKHVDHIIPLSCGGSNDRTNIQYLCAPCNLTKGAKDPILFAQGLGRLL